MAPDQRGYLVSGLKCAYQIGVDKEYESINCPFLLSGGFNVPCPGCERSAPPVLMEIYPFSAPPPHRPLPTPGYQLLPCPACSNPLHEQSQSGAKCMCLTLT